MPNKADITRNVRFLFSFRARKCHSSALQTLTDLFCLAWGRDDDMEEPIDKDDKRNELLWAVLASYLPSGSYFFFSERIQESLYRLFRNK